MRRPRVPGGAWSEGLEYAAGDPNGPLTEMRSKSLAGYKLTEVHIGPLVDILAVSWVRGMRAGRLVTLKGRGANICGWALARCRTLLPLIDGTLRKRLRRWRRVPPKKTKGCGGIRPLMPTLAFGHTALCPRHPNPWAGVTAGQRRPRQDGRKAQDGFISQRGTKSMKRC